ncbi:MAG: ABC transporter permease [Phycisphaerales bacterium]|jgi:hypothetical protein|nr:ABC transporter permease [Phycisphaerales bacterium]
MQFKSLLIDSYRQLSAAKLFWITLGLSLLVVLLFGSIGFNQQGISFFFGLWEIESEELREGSPWARGLYIGIFSTFLVKVWLAWIATILALISTCSIFPEFVHSGSIELTISKPIGRLKLFFSKYLVSLLFVVLQVSIFCIGVFLCVGLRMGEWNWMLFAAIPIVTIFFSYLFSICVLVGSITKSSITALLLTGVFWMCLWSVQSTEAVLNRFVIQQRVDIERFEEGIKTGEEEIEKIILKSPNDSRIESRKRRLEQFKSDTEQSEELLKTLTLWHQPISWILAISPKTSQTINLLNRWLSDPNGFDINAIMSGDMSEFDNMEEIDPTSRNAREREANKRMQEDYDTRSFWYVIGTSLIFEAFVLWIASWHFYRKDF